MPVRMNTGGGVSAGKDTATEADVRYPKTFHSGTDVKARIGSILDCAIKKITPGKSMQTIPKGSYIAEDIEVAGDDNLVTGNIRSGASIFGVSGDQNVVDTSDGNLAAASMLKGQKGYSCGTAVNGEMETLSSESFSPSDSTAYNNCKIVGSAENSFVGAFDYSITGYIAGKIRIHIANLIRGNIRSGAKVGGIGGYIEGTFTGDATAVESDIVKGKTAGINGEMKTGTLTDNSGTVKAATTILNADNSRVEMAIPATAKYSTASKLYITYESIRTLIGLTAAKLANGTTLLGITGTYKGLGDATAADVLSGKKFSAASLSNAEGTMTNNGAKTATLNPGGSYTIPKGYHNGSGKITAKTRYVKQLEAQAYRGFGLSSSDYEAGYEQSFTMPAAGVVYYNGISACYSASKNVTCEIYKNGTLVDSRNMTSSDSWSVRGTMVAKSFSAASGDVIKVVAKATSGTHAIAMMDATIVYFQ